MWNRRATAHTIYGSIFSLINSHLTNADSGNSRVKPPFCPKTTVFPSRFLPPRYQIWFYFFFSSHFFPYILHSKFWHFLLLPHSFFVFFFYFFSSHIFFHLSHHHSISQSVSFSSPFSLFFPPPTAGFRSLHQTQGLYLFLPLNYSNLTYLNFLFLLFFYSSILFSIMKSRLLDKPRFFLLSLVSFLPREEPLFYVLFSLRNTRPLSSFAAIKLALVKARTQRSKSDTTCFRAAEEVTLVVMATQTWLNGN